MENILTILAALCAGISISSITYLIILSLQDIQVDKTERAVETVRRLPVLFRIVLPLAPNFKKIAESPMMESVLKKTKSQLAMGGYEQSLTAQEFIGLRILMLLLGAFLGILLAGSGRGLYGLLITAMFMIYPTTWLRTTVNQRHLSIMKALPNLLDLLTLSVEAGKDFLSALRDILGRRKPDPLGEELLRALQEIQLGKNRQIALREMSQRVGQPELSSVISSIIQADEMGVSIGQLLRIQSDQLRAKRFSLAEKLANETPVKILIPVVVFIFPSVFLVLLGPILMQARSML